MVTSAARPTRRRRLLGAARLRLALLWSLNLFFLFFFLFPFYFQTITALKPDGEIMANPIIWFPSHLDFGHFQGVFTKFGFGRNIVNSLVVAGLTTAICLLFGVFAAYAIAKLPLPAKSMIMVGVVVMVTFPAIALVAPLFIWLRSANLTDTYAALIIPYVAFSLPFTVWVLTNFFRDIPSDLIEQAEVDGCSALQALPGWCCRSPRRGW